MVSETIITVGLLQVTLSGVTGEKPTELRLDRAQLQGSRRALQKLMALNDGPKACL